MGGMLSSDQKAPELPLRARDMAALLLEEALYFLGIIDILTPYDSRKHLEHWFKDWELHARVSECWKEALSSSGPAL